LDNAILLFNKDNDLLLVLLNSIIRKRHLDCPSIFWDKKIPM